MPKKKTTKPRKTPAQSQPVVHAGVLARRQFFETWRQIEETAADAERRKGALLRANGWVWSCRNPRSFWMWEKRLDDGRTVMVDTDTALQFQDAIFA